MSQRLPVSLVLRRAQKHLSSHQIELNEVDELGYPRDDAASSVNQNDGGAIQFEGVADGAVNAGPDRGLGKRTTNMFS